ncbi:DUF6950 family protein [Brucellaceae bacterium C25G]
MSSSISNLVRCEGWDRRLEDVATAHASILPEWGRSDCLMAVGEAINAVVSQNPFERFRGKYKTETGAAKQMRRNGCDNVKQVFETFLSLEPVNRFSARRGDVGVMLLNDEYISGFICSYGFAIKQPHGIAFYPVSEIEQAYKIGL